MRILTWTIRLALFLVLAALAAKNIEPVTLHLFFEHILQAPLAVMLFAAFLLGAACGVFALSTLVFRLRREIAALRKQGLQPAPPA